MLVAVTVMVTVLVVAKISQMGDMDCRLLGDSGCALTHLFDAKKIQKDI